MKSALRAVESGSVARPTISKKKRFDLFKRDGFQCQYCGNKPPAVVLELDHIVAVASGGSSHPDNLITACYDCNRGKAATDLTCIPQSLQEKAALADERRLQVSAYERALRRARIADNLAVDRVVQVYEHMRPGFTVNERGRGDILRFLEQLPPSDVADAMELAFCRVGNQSPHDHWRYFCGICWNKIKGR